MSHFDSNLATANFTTPTGAKLPTVFVLEDDEDARQSVVRTLESIGLHVRAFDTPSELVAAYDGESPGCLVLDLCLPQKSGLQLFEEIVEQFGWVATIFISGFAEIDCAVEAMQYGAINFLEKPVSRNRLLEQVNRAIELDRLMRSRRNERAGIEAKIQSLSSREQQVLNLVMIGQSTKEIAKTLSINQKTVEGHRANLFRKMDVRSLPQLSLLMVKLEKLRGVSGALCWQGGVARLTTWSESALGALNSGPVQFRPGADLPNNAG